MAIDSTDQEQSAAKSYHYYCLSAFIHIHNRIHSLNSSRIKSVRLNEALPLRLNELLKHPLQLILLHLPQAPLSLLTSLDKTDGMKDSGQSKQHNSRGFIRSWGSNPGIRPIHQPSKASQPTKIDPVAVGDFPGDGSPSYEDSPLKLERGSYPTPDNKNRLSQLAVADRASLHLASFPR